MKLFTSEERRILQFLAAFFLFGLLVTAGREYWAQSGGDEQQNRREYLQSFQAGADNYRAAGNSKDWAFPTEVVDINRAGLTELQTVGGIGPVLAKKIIDYRLKNGYFQTVQDLVKINGIGPKLIARWEKQLIVGPDTTIVKDSTGE